jgi:hypothetical protein
VAIVQEGLPPSNDIDDIAESRAGLAATAPVVPSGSAATFAGMPPDLCLMATARTAGPPGPLAAGPAVGIARGIAVGALSA